MKTLSRCAHAVLAPLIVFVSCSSGTNCSENPLTPDCLARLTVSVMIDGAPASGVALTLSGPTPGSSMTDGSGTATFTDLTAGSYTASVDDPEVQWDLVQIAVTLVPRQTGSASFNGIRLIELITFASDRQDPNFEIYSMRADGTQVRRLTDDPAKDRNPSWAPGGGQVAFDSNRDGGFNVWSINADGSNADKLSTSISGGRSPAWFPGTGRVTFISNESGNFDIYTMNPNGSELDTITVHPDRDLAPAWSPAGDVIVFQSDRTGFGEMEIFAITTQGGAAIPLTNTPGFRNLTPA